MHNQLLFMQQKYNKFFKQDCFLKKLTFGEKAKIFLVF
ncbi:hypothetical protein AB406_2368 [Riemerella anatipestifer]|uniref:Uncharacterized protein n=1 Tax=Riemerella anatipestifer TaxID=34085 RepID=A0A1S7DW07_RIEAN|nr:hypothetical protein AB406_2368 [Riemerella anatipestifer]